MKAPFGCKLLGAQQALGGIRDGVILFHSVVGCNFGSMAFHFASCDMTEVRQTCTVISDNEVVFGGEHALEKALSSAEELLYSRIRSNLGLPMELHRYFPSRTARNIGNCVSLWKE